MSRQMTAAMPDAPRPGEEEDLASLLDRLLDRGIAAELELRIGVGGTDLVRLSLQLMAASEFRIADREGGRGAAPAPHGGTGGAPAALSGWQP